MNMHHLLPPNFTCGFLPQSCTTCSLSISLWLLLGFTPSPDHRQAVQPHFPAHLLWLLTLHLVSMFADTGDICLHHPRKPSISRFPPCAMGRCNLPEHISAIACLHSFKQCTCTLPPPPPPLHTPHAFPSPLFLSNYYFRLLDIPVAH